MNLDFSARADISGRARANVDRGEALLERQRLPERPVGDLHRLTRHRDARVFRLDRPEYDDSRYDDRRSIHRGGERQLDRRWGRGRPASAEGRARAYGEGAIAEASKWHARNLAWPQLKMTSTKF